MNIGALLEAVQRNCHIADARYAREMTLCNYLLEMREFYRWEHDLPGDAPPSREAVGSWISEREALWETLAEEDFVDLPLAGGRYAPFDAAAVNGALLPEGLVYGAGIGRFKKPHFFLGRLLRQESHGELTVLVTGCEYARDLTTIPAALQGGTVIVRQEALRQWLREKAEIWGVKRPDGPMARALAAYGYGEDAAAALARMGATETETLILHERGEYAAGRIVGPAWEEMLAAGRSRRAELVARAVRDNWADCLSTLPALLERQAWGSLHFWFANFDGLRQALFPALDAAYAEWAAGGDADALAEALGRGREHWQDVALRLLAAGEDEVAALSRDHGAIAL